MLNDQYAQVRLTKTRWTLIVDLSKKTDSEIIVHASRNLIRVQGKYREKGRRKTFDRCFSIPEGYICDSVVQAGNCKLVCRATKQKDVPNEGEKEMEVDTNGETPVPEPEERPPSASGSSNQGGLSCFIKAAMNLIGIRDS